MPGPRRHRMVASVSALLLVLGGVVLLGGTSGAAAGAAVTTRPRQHTGHASATAGKAKPTDRTKPRHGKAAQRKAAQRKAARARAEKLAAERREARRRARMEAIWGKVDPRRPHTWPTWAPDHYTPPDGPRFNDPYAGRHRRRALLTHVIRTINSSPGYRLSDPLTRQRLSCPSDPALAPSTIKIAVYSVADMSFARALAAAHRRCVSVKVMMNSHLTTVTSRSWGRIVAALGKRPRHWWRARSFAMRCTNGCLGTSVMHAKYFLFSHAGSAHDVVMTGSSNMTSNAVDVQWNDLFTATGNRQLYAWFRNQFRRMEPDRPRDGPWARRTGRYRTVFYPDRAMTPRTDEVTRTLRNVTCTGARDGAGIHGHTVLYIAMHAWFGTRGHYLAAQVRKLRDEGCYVRILYSFLSRTTYEILGHGPRLQLRRVQFPGVRHVFAIKYSHMKLLAISGRLGADRSAWVSWTGSNNWTDRGDSADEVALRVSSRRVYQAYVEQWHHICDTRSTPVWAKYHEPVGGGRAP